MNCKKCAKCCKNVVVFPTKADIRNISSLGFRKMYFTEIESFGPHEGKFRLKRKQNGDCIFLRKNKHYFRNVHSARPATCKIVSIRELRVW